MKMLLFALSLGFFQASAAEVYPRVCSLSVMQRIIEGDKNSPLYIGPESKIAQFENKPFETRKLDFVFKEIVPAPNPQYSIVAAQSGDVPAFSVTFELGENFYWVSMGKDKNDATGRFAPDNFGLNAYVKLPNGEEGIVVLTCVQK